MRGKITVNLKELY